MGKPIPVDKLPLDVRQEIEARAKIVPQKIVVLGKILQTLEGIPKRDAIWVLKQAIKQLGGKA